LSAESCEPTGLDRRNLAARTRAVLNHGGWGNPDVLLVESALGAVVVKDFAPRTRYVRRWLGPWLLRREAQAYRRLDGLEAVPRLLGQLDGAALVLEYRPGVLLSRSLAGQLPPTFLAELQDFASAMRFDRSTWWGRVGVALLGWVDRRALRKWQVRLV